MVKKILKITVGKNLPDPIGGKGIYSVSLQKN